MRRRQHAYAVLGGICRDAWTSSLLMDERKLRQIQSGQNDIFLLEISYLVKISSLSLIAHMVAVLPLYRLVFR